MNAVLVAVIVMLTLALLRAHVVVSLIIGALVGGLVGGLSLHETIHAFNNGIKGGASIALSYAMLGAFAVAISRSGLPHSLAAFAIRKMETGTAKSYVKWCMLLLILAVSISSQNLIPIHIAFIPLLIPPLLYVMAQLKLDRRLVACIMTFGLITPYIFFPVGFGEIFLKQILLKNIELAGMDVSHINVMHAMLIPALGMLSGLLIAIFVSYRKPREYDMSKIQTVEYVHATMNARSLIVSIIAILMAFAVQIYTDSMVIGALSGFLIFVASGVCKWSRSNEIFSEGVRMMAMVGFVMITAQGFAEVIRDTGQVHALAHTAAAIFGGSKPMAALAMLLVGLFITMGIGSSFSTVPILAAIYVPLCMQLGFSPMATMALIGTAGALGDAGSPASDSTLGPTSGLDVDGQHDHIWDTVVPTFLHYNLPLLIAGWIAAMVL